MKWFKIKLTKQQLKSGELTKIVDKFYKHLKFSNNPIGMSLWANRPTKPGETNTVYFSPVAVENSETIIREYNCKLCNKPRIEKVSLLVGRADAWDIFQK